MPSRGKRTELSRLVSKAKKKLPFCEATKSIKDYETRRHLRQLLSSPEARKRANSMFFLLHKIEQIRNSEVSREKLLELLPFLKHALFDNFAPVRQNAFSAFSKVVGLRKAVKFIEKKYPEDSLSNLPIHYFSEHSPFEIGGG